MDPLYDRIGLDYANLRRPDPRIAAQIDAALGQARSVLNVGAGAGAYEPANRVITALEPSAAMIAQRPPSAATGVQGTAEDMPFADNSFDAAMATLTVHHWSDPARGLRQMRRVARGPLVVLTFDPTFREFWLLDYFPGLAALDEAQMPPLGAFADWLGATEVANVPIPHDCTDGFLAAYWRCPEAYLDRRVRAAMSPFWALGDVTDGLARLDADLRDGTWDAHHGHLRGRDTLDCGYRLVTA